MLKRLPLLLLGLIALNAHAETPEEKVHAYKQSKQQEAFLKSIMGGLPGWNGSGPAPDAGEASQNPAEELAEIKRQFAELQKKLSKL